MSNPPALRALDFFITFADAAVEAIAGTDVGELDEASEMDLRADVLKSGFHCPCLETGEINLVFAALEEVYNIV